MTNKRSVLRFDKPKLFSPVFTKKVFESDGTIVKTNAQDLTDTNILSTSSFRYDPPFSGIKSTQQIPVDFSKFENHTFFNSAEVNVNVAFDKIINQFPFDGSRKESEIFFDSLTGFEKYVYDRFPKNIGFLNFRSNGTTGNYIRINDFAGTTFSTISKNQSGEQILNPGIGSFAIEMHILPVSGIMPSVVCQKISGSNNGFTLALSSSGPDTSVIFGITSGSRGFSVSSSIDIDQFSHLVAEFDRRPGVNKLRLYLNEKMTVESNAIEDLNEIDFNVFPLLIGSGVQHSRIAAESKDLLPKATFSGSIDEFRFFHDTRNIKLQKLFGRKTIFTSDKLKLYLKLNEPTGTFGQDSLVIDSSGNSLHGIIVNYDLLNSTLGLRNTSSIDNPMSFEKLDISPVLFPAYEKLRSLNSDFLVSANEYDQRNPNLITKLIPPHYLEEGQAFDGLQDEEGTIGDEISSVAPGEFNLGSSQLLAAFLYTWAKFFDEIKMMVDMFGTIIFVDYDKPGYAADQFLSFIANYYGCDLPAFFAQSSIEQYTNADNLGVDIGYNALSLQAVQNQLWRRVLTDLQEIIRSKGTLHSIKSIFRSLGIDPDDTFRIREFGGPTVRTLQDSREPKREISTMLSFSGSLANITPSALDPQGFSSNIPAIISRFLSGSRSEPGFPKIVGSLVPFRNEFGILQNISDHSSDGLFTSGSWTYEGIYKFSPVLLHKVTQSLVRMQTTGTAAWAQKSGGVLINLQAISGSDIVLFAKPFVETSIPRLELHLTGANVFDGQQWHISFGRVRGDEFENSLSSSYFIRAARQSFGRIEEIYTTSSVYTNVFGTSTNYFETQDSLRNASGSFLVIGSQSLTLDNDPTTKVFLNDVSDTSDARYTDFSGLVSQIRFWSRALKLDEWQEHIRNFRSVGTDDPTSTFNFVSTRTGSFGKIRLDVETEQPVSRSNADGTFKVFDFSQNHKHFYGQGFEPEKIVLIPERFFYSQLSPKFDESVSDNKVRVRSWQQFENVQLFGGEIAPLYEVPRLDQPNDDTRFSIDFSIMDALNEDMIKIFSTLEILDNIIGDPELVFSPDYPGLESLREVYFNRLTDRISLKQFFEFFKWFDSMFGISTFIEQLIPRKTKFQGINFVVENHMLERSKFEYQYFDIYQGENTRHGLKGTILLQQFAATLKRF